jgi:hypothetical protein
MVGMKVIVMGSMMADDLDESMVE